MTTDSEHDRPMPGAGHGDDGSAADAAELEANPTGADDGDSDQDRIDRDKLDFDPDDGLYSGTAVDGTSDIPGPHEHGDDVEPDADADSEAGSDADSKPGPRTDSEHAGE